MRVLEDHDHWLLARQTLQLPDQRLQYPLLLSLRTEVRRRVALRSREGHKIGDECHILVRRIGAGEQGLQLLQLGRRRVVACEPRCPAELVDERKQRTVLVIGRAEIAGREGGWRMRRLPGRSEFAVDSPLEEARFEPLVPGSWLASPVVVEIRR